MLTLQALSVPDVPSLTAMFTVLYFLAATQDIAVDGWALTMLRQENILEHSRTFENFNITIIRPENVGYAATCNTVGVRTGWNFAYVVLTTLEVLQLVKESNLF